MEYYWHFFELAIYHVTLHTKCITKSQLPKIYDIATFLSLIITFFEKCFQALQFPHLQTMRSRAVALASYTAVDKIIKNTVVCFFLPLTKEV